MRRLDGLAGRLAATGGAAIALALFVGGGGCELEVGDTIPDFNCQPASPGEPDPCPPDFICSTGSRKCVSAAAPCQPSCPSGMQCDRVTAQCMRADASVAHKPDASAHPDAGDARDEAVGDESLADSGEAGGNEAMTQPESSSDCRVLTCACAGASFCDSNLCSSMQTVTAQVAAANSMVNFCTKPCCTSADCSATTVCFAAGTGGNYCVPPVSIGRVAPLGASIGGAMCKIPSECRSGVCASGTCADTCCSSTPAQQASQCAAGSICRFSTFPGNTPDTHYTAWCGPPGNGMVAGGGACGLDGVCASNRCGVAIAFCESACRSSTDCPTNLACTYTAGLANKDLAAGCVPMMGGGAEGTSCRANNDCATNFCDTTGSSSGTMGHCSSICFADSDCTIKDWHCRPANVMLANVPYYILSCGT